MVVTVISLIISAKTQALNNASRLQETKATNLLLCNTENIALVATQLENMVIDQSKNVA